jgi:phenylacetate-CoA ligase
MNSKLSKYFIYNPIFSLRGEKVGQYGQEVKQFHKLPLVEMKQRQWNKLLSILSYSYDNNAYYGKLFDDNYIKPGDIKDVSELKKIPYLTKKIIQEDYTRLISPNHRRLSHRKTSGSTGMPLKFVKDMDSLAYMDAVMYEVYGWHGIKMGDPQCRIWGLPADLKSRLSIKSRDFLLNRIRLSSFDVSDDSSREFYHSIRKFKPVFMYAVPSYTTDFAKRLQKMSLDPKGLGLKAIILTGEIFYAEQKKYIREAFGCPVINEYGTTECGILAFACPNDNMHLMMHNVFFEFVNPQTGTEVQPGEPGEIVITELHGKALPFIRYRLGDIVTPKGGVCACGSQLPMVSHIEGRLEDMITTPEGKKVAGGMLYYTLTKGIQQFKVYQKSIDSLEVLIEKGPGFSEDYLSDVKNKWRIYLGNRMKVEFKIVDKIPPDKSGKLRYFVSEFDQNTE